MNVEFHLSIFRFDKDKDYEPYFKKYCATCNPQESLMDVLNSLYKQDPFLGLPSADAYALANTCALSVQTSMEEIRRAFGEELVLEPLSKKRSNHDFIMNTDDFDEIFARFQAIVSEAKKQDYDKYIAYFYTSPALKYDKKHLGTSAFLYADELIKKFPSKTDEILSFIDDKKHGIYHHVSLDFRVFKNECEKIVDDLKQELAKG